MSVRWLLTHAIKYPTRLRWSILFAAGHIYAECNFPSLGIVSKNVVHNMIVVEIFKLFWLFAMIFMTHVRKCASLVIFYTSPLNLHC